MIKKQQKWIALFVVCTFMWLMQVSTMPAAAAGTTEQVSSAGAEQGPDYYEAVNHKAAPAKKKSMLPIILIGVGLVAVTAAVLFLVVLKSYDITGTWYFTTLWGSNSATNFSLVFTGDKKTGTFKEGSAWTGPYTVDGKNVTWSYPIFSIVFTGKFTGKDTLSGTMTSTIPGSTTGTFTAVRTAAAAGSGNNGPGGTGKEIK
jgi:hypothetical protein